jgi:hypothetical protein
MPQLKNGSRSGQKAYTALLLTKDLAHAVDVEDMARQKFDALAAREGCEFVNLRPLSVMPTTEADPESLPDGFTPTPELDVYRYEATAV